MAFIYNILKMYKNDDGHVEVLSASVRSTDHFMYSLLKDISYKEVDLNKKWAEFDIGHDLTNKGHRTFFF